MSHKLSPTTHPTPPQLEEQLLARWKKQQTFERSLELTKGKPRFTFYDGPPFATGMPHYGHLLQGTIKDVIPRFKTMQGFFVERRFGWDTHGLPVEYELEKELGIKTRQEILEMGIDTFNEACRGIVLRHAKDFEKATVRLGRWIDFENDYKTLDPDYMETVWWVIKQLYKKELLIEDRKAMHICPRCATPLSNFEVTLGYADRHDPAVYVSFPVEGKDFSLVAWTTTPWTVPANVLLAVNPELEYAVVEHQGAKYVVASTRVAHLFGEDAAVLETLHAKDLVGLKYEPPFPVADLEGRHYKVVASEYVSADEGTGILHCAPAFGEEDMEIGREHGAAFIQHIDITGHFTVPFEQWSHLTALEANDEIVAELKKLGRLVRKETINHAYPHCWRCGTPLLNYAISSWFVKVTAIKERLIEENKEINWTPDHVRDGRFGKWLEGARDWSISRNRFWGNPLPIWKCEAGHLTVIGSLDELEKLSGERPEDLHKHFVDKITFACPVDSCDGEAHRIEDVLDCWFESGSMPYGSQHYPFEHEKDFDQKFPADFIAEGLDQTRGWFYTLHVLGTALMDSKAYQNVVTTGLVMAEDGKKMSKSLKNYPDPDRMFAEYGADSLRLYLMQSPIVRGENLNFAETGVREVMQTFVNTLLNTQTFLTTYANGWEVQAPGKPKHLLDRWIVSRLNSVTSAATEALEAYDLMTAARLLTDFVEELSNWYVRRSRKRFAPTNDTEDREQAIATLHHVLTTTCQLIAPFVPFVADYLYQSLTGKESVHLTSWPQADTSAINGKLENEMRLARSAVRLGLAARSRAGLKVRQPLAEVKVVTHGVVIPDELLVIIGEELNVKTVSVASDDDPFVETHAIPNPKILGPIFGKDAQKAIAAIKAGEYELSDAALSVLGRTIEDSDAVTISYHPTGEFVVESDPNVVVGLTTEITDELRAEGQAREVIRQLQDLRKAEGLAVGDVVKWHLSVTDSALRATLNAHQQLIASETGASSLELSETGIDNGTDLDVDDHTVSVQLTRP